MDPKGLGSAASPWAWPKRLCPVPFSAVKTVFRWCVDSELLQKHRLISVEDYYNDPVPFCSAPKGICPQTPCIPRELQGHPAVAKGHPMVADPPQSPLLLFPHFWLSLLFFSCLACWTGLVWVVSSSLAQCFQGERHISPAQDLMPLLAAQHLEIQKV